MRVVLLVAGGAAVAVSLSMWLTAMRAGFWLPPIGVDFDTYLNAAGHWAQTGEWYRPYQLEGPYDVWGFQHGSGPILYPPTAILLYLPFQVIPHPLYWLVPLVGTAAIVVSHRPPWQAWPLIVGLAIYPGAVINTAWNGNIVMWGLFFVALATRWPFFGSWVLLKPTLAPFALVGIWRRQWWLGLGVLALASLPFAYLFADYVTVLRNAQTADGIVFYATAWLVMLIPLIAWASGHREVVLLEVGRRQRAPVAHDRELQT